MIRRKFQKIPTERWITAKKRSLGVKVLVVKEKPEINSSYMKARALYAENMIAKNPPGSANHRLICTLDEKLLCAEDTAANV